MSRNKRSGVYQITNEVNGKFYVGSSKDIDSRWANWRYYFNKPMKYKSLLKAAVQKYGIDNFTFIVIEECYPDKKTLEDREQHYLDLLQPAYNLMKKAYSSAGYVHSEETLRRLRASYTEERRASMSAWMSEYMSNPEVRDSYSKLRKGKTFEEIFGIERAQEIKAKIAQSHIDNPRQLPEPWNKGQPALPHVNEALQAGRQRHYEDNGVWNKGLPCREETKEKLSEYGKERWVDPEFRNRISQALKGKKAWNKGVPMSEERCREMSEDRKANFDPKQQSRITELARIANTGKTHSEERRRKTSEANKASPARKAFSESLRGKSREGSTSDYYGVFKTKSGKWRVQIRNKYYGQFDNLEDAVVRSLEVLS